MPSLCFISFLAVLGYRNTMNRHWRAGRIYQRFKHHFLTDKEKKPKAIRGLEGIYSLKNLSEAIQ